MTPSIIIFIKDACGAASSLLPNDVSPAIHATIQMTEPTDIAATIPEGPVEPVILKTSVVRSSVAIVMPDTGLFELPTRPTILDETAPKKNPNITTNSAPGSDMGTCGMRHIKRITATIPAATSRRSRSRAVLFSNLKKLFSKTLSFCVDRNHPCRIEIHRTTKQLFDRLENTIERKKLCLRKQPWQVLR